VISSWKKKKGRAKKKKKEMIEGRYTLFHNGFRGRGKREEKVNIFAKKGVFKEKKKKRE